MANQANSTFAQELYQKIAMEVLPYMGIYPTEEVTPELLASLGLEQDDVGEGAIQTFDAIDSYGTYHTDARVEDGKVVDGNGNVIEGVTISEDGTVYDAYMNQVFTVQPETVDDPKVDNPEMALPPAENANNTDNGTVWDAAATDEGANAQ